MSASGSVVGAVSGISGSWTNRDAAGAFVGAPSSITCHIDGATLADVSGTGTYDGRPGYAFSLHVQDRGVPGTATRSPGVAIGESLTGTRTYHPGVSTDGTLAFAQGAMVAVPASLPVATGNAGDEWASITFVDHDSGSPLRCLYRGDAAEDCDHDDATAHGVGRNYVFVACQWGAPAVHHDDECEHEHEHARHDDHSAHHEMGDDECNALDWTTDPTIVAGYALDVNSILLHVADGSSHFPTPRAPITVVTWAFSATPFVIRLPEPDYYRLLVFDPAGAVVDFVDGDLTSGDLIITSP